MTSTSGLLRDHNSELDYPLSYVHTKPRLAVYVLRRCEGGCGRVLEFSPLPGTTRLQPCSMCKRMTYWRVVV